MEETRLKSVAIRKPTEFVLTPDADARARLAEELGIRGIRKLRFAGVIAPEGTSDLLLAARLGATVIQDCVVTSEPVTTRIDEDVTRSYLADMPAPAGDEVEMPEDDTAEALPDEIELALIMAEALALALPPWPRVAGADPVEISVTEPGKTPMSDEDARGFGVLRSLRDHMKEEDDNGA